MVVQRLIKLFSLEHKKDKHGWWLDAEYGLTSAGVRVVTESLAVPDMRNTQTFLCEITTAYSVFEENERWMILHWKTLRLTTRAKLVIPDRFFRDNPQSVVPDSSRYERLSSRCQPLCCLATSCTYFRYMERLLKKAVGT